MAGIIDDWNKLLVALQIRIGISKTTHLPGRRLWKLGGLWSPPAHHRLHASLAWGSSSAGSPLGLFNHRDWFSGGERSNLPTSGSVANPIHTSLRVANRGLPLCKGAERWAPAH